MSRRCAKAPDPWPPSAAPKTGQEQSTVRLLYTSSKFSNWGPGYLRGYAKTINYLLISKTRRSFTSRTQADGLSALKRDTLFLPRSLQMRYAAFTAKEKGGDDEELQQRILTATKPIYYLTYVRSSSEKYVSVFNGKTGELLYADFTPISYNFKGKDLKKLAKAVD